MPESVTLESRQVSAQIAALEQMITEGKQTAAQFAELHLAEALRGFASAIAMSSLTNSRVSREAENVRLSALTLADAATALGNCTGDADCETKAGAQAAPLSDYNAKLRAFTRATG